MAKKAYRRRMWKMMGKESYLRGIWEHFSCERSKAKRSRQLADDEKQARIQGQWQQASPAREYLKQVKCHDTDFNEPMMKTVFIALNKWDLGRISRNLQGKDERLRMGLRQDKRGLRFVAQDEVEKMSFVQEIMLRSTDYLGRIIAPVGGQGGVTMSYLCPRCNSFHWKTAFCGSLGENPRCGGAQFVEKSTIGSNRTGFWSNKQVTVLRRPRYSKHMQY